MKIRNAVENDVKKVYEFICGLEVKTFDNSIFENYYFSNLKNENNIYLIAENEKNQTVGFLSCHGQLLLHHLDWVYEIQELYIDESQRNQKIGALLLNEIEKRLIKKGIKDIEVSSHRKREDAHRFYIRNNYNQSHFKFTKELKNNVS